MYKEFIIKEGVNYSDEYYQEKDKIGIYTIRNLLGEGRFGIVYLACDEDGNRYVIKQLKKGMIKNRNKLLYEEMTLKKLHHVCFPRFISSFKDGDREGYVLEYIEGTVFEDILRKDRYQFKREEIYEVCEQLLNIVEILHNYGIVHRDIRLPNVIRKSNNQLSLLDFGLARFIDSDHYTKEQDYWYLGDFLIHLYYSSYQKDNIIEEPWFNELDLISEEKVFLKRLMGIEESYNNIQEIREQLKRIKNVV